LADNGYVVLINKHYKKGNPKTGKNTEYTVDGVISDLKSPKSNPANGFHHAVEQKLTEFVCNLNNISLEKAIKGFDNGFRFQDKIEKVIVIYNNKVKEISKKNYIDGSYIDILKKMY
jgi:exonuclease VII small subunit